jgi:hypothetical protein
MSNRTKEREPLVVVATKTRGGEICLSKRVQYTLSLNREMNNLGDRQVRESIVGLVYSMAWGSYIQTGRYPETYRLTIETERKKIEVEQ